MFPQFGATADTLSKASTLVFRIGTDAHLYDDPEDVNIAPLLDSKFDSEKCEALKRLLALIAQGFDVSNFFPQVVKNVASQSLEVKKLVYLYLLHYAEKRPNEALLSINCFQKDLGDPNPYIRGWALRTMAGIRLHVIAPLVLVAAGKCARDPSVYVRKCAANALPKLYDLRLEEHTSSIEEIVGTLLNDHSPGVLGAAAAAFASVCPNNFSLIGKSYQRLCEILPDVEEWGQIVLIGILLRFVIARHGLVRESIMFALHFAESYNSEKDGLAGKISVKEDTGYVSGNDDLGLDGDMTGNTDLELASMVSRCYIEGPDEYLSRLSYPNQGPSVGSGVQFTSGRSNNDVKILLQCTSPLLWSNNSAVVLAAAGVHWIMAPREDVKRIVKPLLFVLRSSAASKYVVLCNIEVFAKAMSSLFAQYFEDFFVCSSDSYPIKALKLEILSSIATDSSVSFIFKEFQDYIRDPDRRFAADTVAAIGLCAQRLPKMAKSCMEGLLTLTRQEVLSSGFVSVEGEADVLIQAIISIKSVIKQDPLSHEKVIIQLIRSLDSIKVPAARAMIIWMVGEYSSLGDTIPRMLTTVLKYIAWHFISEALETKLQILNSIVKVLLYARGDESWSLKEVLNYVLELAVCDLNYDVRDRARFLKKILSCSSDPQGLKEETNTLPQNKELSLVLAECIFRGQTTPVSAVSMSYRFYLPGSLSQIVLHAAPGYEPLPKPCSFLYDDLNLSNMRHRTNALERSRSSESYNTDDPDSLSGSLNEESASDYSSQRSITGSNVSGGSDDTGSANEGDDSADPLIQISDVGNASNLSHSGSADLGEVISKRGLESWLNDQPGVSGMSTSEQSQIYRSLARISVGDIGCRVKPKSYTLLDPTNGNGLKVDYTFSSEVSTISQHLVSVEVFFENCSSEPMADIFLVDDESSKGLNSADQMLVTADSSLTSHTEVPIIVSMEAISSLEPGQTAKRIIQVRFHHHLLPLKLALFCNDKKLPVKLRPDIGYFVKPLPMGIETFTEKESRLPGMFEYVRSCRFTDHIGELNKGKVENLVMKDNFLVICECLALKMLGNANLFLVSVDMPVAANLGDASGLCLRFSSEILSSSIPCLITITVEGKCYDPLNLSIKVNCAETVFGLNLLNRVVNFLAESSPALL